MKNTEAMYTLYFFLYSPWHTCKITLTLLAATSHWELVFSGLLSGSSIIFPELLLSRILPSPFVWMAQILCSCVFMYVCSWNNNKTLHLAVMKCILSFRAQLFKQSRLSVSVTFSLICATPPLCSSSANFIRMDFFFQVSDKNVK